MTDQLMPRDEVAALFGIAPSAVRSTLRRYGITEQRGYPRERVEAAAAARPGRGARTDLKPRVRLTEMQLVVIDGSPVGEVTDWAPVTGHFLVPQRWNGCRGDIHLRDADHPELGVLATLPIDGILTPGAEVSLRGVEDSEVKVTLDLA